jgi:hypothetical protein
MGILGKITGASADRAIIEALNRIADTIQLAVTQPRDLARLTARLKQARRKLAAAVAANQLPTKEK